MATDSLHTNCASRLLGFGGPPRLGGGGRDAGTPTFPQARLTTYSGSSDSDAQRWSRDVDLQRWRFLPVWFPNLVGEHVVGIEILIPDSLKYRVTEVPGKHPPERLPETCHSYFGLFSVV